MKKYTYKVVTDSYSEPNYHCDVEETIDKYAEKGWRLNSFSSFEDTGWDMEGYPKKYGIHVTFIFEKEAEE